MANRKLTVLPEFTAISDDDLGYIVDVSDTSESPNGTSKKVKYLRLKAFLKPYFDTLYEAKLLFVPENRDNKQNSLTVDGTATKYPTVDAVNAAIIGFTTQVTCLRFAGLGQNYTIPTGAIAVNAHIDGYIQYLEQLGFESDLNTFTQTDNIVTFNTTIESGSQILIQYYL